MSDLLVWLIVGGLIFGVLTYAWPVLLAAGILWIMFKIVGGIHESQRIDREFRRDTHKALIDRADRQHHAIMSGDLVTGTYGEHLPPQGLR